MSSLFRRVMPFRGVAHRRFCIPARFNLWVLLGCLSTTHPSLGAAPQVEQAVTRQASAYRVTGEPLYADAPGVDLVARARVHQQAYQAHPEDPDKLIWHGRFLAYQGRYHQAIEIYTRGIEQFPRDARMWRHRGHRYITLRQFDKALADLDQAMTLIQGQPNEIEPDGMPNAAGIPISTLHGNIYYHKGLAHYLQAEWKPALQAYQRCLSLKTNDDNVVSCTHWIYMIHRRMGQAEQATQALGGIRGEMNIVENFGYHRTCLFYKGVLSADELLKEDEQGPANDAVRYAIANWHFCNGDVDLARQRLREIVAGDTWASFGHIAAEVDLSRMK